MLTNELNTEELKLIVVGSNMVRRVLAMNPLRVFLYKKVISLLIIRPYLRPDDAVSYIANYLLYLVLS